MQKTTLRLSRSVVLCQIGTFSLCDRREGFLVHTTDGANPIFRQVFKRGTRGNPAIGVANLGIIYITANAFILHTSQHLLLELNQLADAKRKDALRQFRSGFNIANINCKDKYNRCLLPQMIPKNHNYKNDFYKTA